MGKSPFLMGTSTISMAIFNSYVKLPEGIYRGFPKMGVPPNHPFKYDVPSETIQQLGYPQWETPDISLYHQSPVGSLKHDQESSIILILKPTGQCSKSLYHFMKYWLRTGFPVLGLL